MSQKKPLNEGSVRSIQKGINKPIQSTNTRPIKPPPAPKPTPPKK
jgi:hypothetical protein